MSHNLSEKWIKASIAGTIWAASEIVLGSFLHNLRIPFSGNILTAIGLIILISINHKWNEKGLFWRAGLICALMKTMSPSAVIFGPMIGIFAESVLMEISTRLLGRTIAGYAVGAMLAMSWNLFQKIGNYIIFYGSTIIEVYSNLLKMAQKQLNIQTDIVWLPIILLLIIFALFGLLSAVIGIRVGRKMLSTPFISVNSRPDEAVNEIFPNKQPGSFPYSVAWLVIDIALLILGFLLIVYTKWYIWIPAVTTTIVVWALRYKRALRQLSKPKFWVLFVLITLVTALVLTKPGKEESYIMAGLLTGIQMNFRAALIIIGFSALGTELYNPVVRTFFMRTTFRNLPLAMELSAESLPAFIAAIPDLKSIIKNPVSIFYNVIARAEQRFTEIKGTRSAHAVYIITGERGEGKTTWVKKLIDTLKKKNINAGGIISERIMTGDDTVGYNITDLSRNKSYRFLDSTLDGAEKIGKFTILNEGLERGKAILRNDDHFPVVIVDEAGRLELAGKGWAESIGNLLEQKIILILVVRDEFAEKIAHKWNIRDAKIFNIRECSPGEMAERLSVLPSR